MPIPANLISLIAAAVDAMSLAGGYNFDYGPVDVHTPAARIYPQVYLEQEEEAQAGTQMAGKETFGVPLTFRILVARGAGDLMVETGKVIDDIKKLLDGFAGPGFLYFENPTSKAKKRLVVAVPIELKITVSLVYRQSRQDPASP